MPSTESETDPCLEYLPMGGDRKANGWIYQVMGGDSAADSASGEDSRDAQGSSSEGWPGR